MPIGGWGGLRKGDNGQAIAIAKVMQLFVDQGIEVWLRFAHEVNYYQSTSSLPSHSGIDGLSSGRDVSRWDFRVQRRME